MRNKANDVKRGGWSAHRLADEAGYAIDMKQKLKQGDIKEDRARATGRKMSARDTGDASPSNREGSRKKSSTSRRRR